MKLGPRIREFRQQAGLSQEKLAWNAGIAPAFLGQLERGLKSPTVKTLEKLANALNISVAELFTGPIDLDDDEKTALKQIMFQLHDLPVKELHHISVIIEQVREVRRYEQMLFREERLKEIDALRNDELSNKDEQE